MLRDLTKRQEIKLEESRNLGWDRGDNGIIDCALKIEGCSDGAAWSKTWESNFTLCIGRCQVVNTLQVWKDHVTVRNIQGNIITILQQTHHCTVENMDQGYSQGMTPIAKIVIAILALRLSIVISIISVTIFQNFHKQACSKSFAK